jgi:hypothetical protein
MGSALCVFVSVEQWCQMYFSGFKEKLVLNSPSFQPTVLEHPEAFLKNVQECSVFFQIPGLALCVHKEKKLHRELCRLV